jgi:hypothetical protein
MKPVSHASGDKEPAGQTSTVSAEKDYDPVALAIFRVSSEVYSERGFKGRLFQGQG